jgi:hypothetical protein
LASLLTQAQAREVRAGLVPWSGRKTSHQFQQAAIRSGLGLHHLAAAAGQHRAGDAIVTQHLHRGRVTHAQARQQAFRRVDAACDVASGQRQFLRRQCFELGVQTLGHDGFGHQALDQWRGIVGQRRHRHGGNAKTRQQRNGACDQALAMLADQLLQALRNEIDMNLQDDSRPVGLPGRSTMAGGGCSEQEPGTRCPVRMQTRPTGRPLEFERLSGKCFLASSGASPLLQAMAQIIAADTSSQAIPTVLM